MSVCLTPLAATAQHAPDVAREDGAELRRAFDQLLAKRVTVRLDHVSREAALKALARSAQVPVQYRVLALDAYPGLVTLHATDLPLGVALERVLDGTRLRVVPDGMKRIMIEDAETAALRDSIPTGTIAGRVVDSATGRGIVGAVIKVAGTKRSTTATDSGQFTLRDAPAGDYVLSIKAFGYRVMQRNVTVVADQRITVRALLVAAPNVLSGVVTTATGVQERRAVGADVTRINADSIMQVAPIKSVTDLLETRVPGLTVEHTSGLPGAPSRIRLRGIGGGLVSGANTSNDPILIVDGIRVNAQASTPRAQNLAPGSSQYLPPSPLDQIDPNSIETIEVFKGPSATAQWGSDAGNGVIVITTKKGRPGRTRLDVALAGDVSQMPGTYAAPGFFPFASNEDGYVGSARCDAYPVSDGKSTRFCGLLGLDSVARFQALDHSRLSPFGMALSNDATTTVSGGPAIAVYAMTLSAGNRRGYLELPAYYRDVYRRAYGVDAPGWMRHPDSERKWGTNFSLTLLPSPTVTTRLMASLNQSNVAQGSGQTQLSALSTMYLDTVAGLDDPKTVAPFVQRARNNLTTSNLAATATWLGWRGLHFDGTAGISTEEREDRTITPGGILGADTLGRFALGRGHAIIRTAALHGNTVPSNRLSLSFGLDFNQRSNEDMTGSADTVTRGVETPTSLEQVALSSATTNTTGWWVEPRVTVSERLYLSPGLRLDGGSASGSARNSAGGLSKLGSIVRSVSSGDLLSLFPMIRLAWVAIDPNDQRSVGPITLLRPRLAFGIAGVQPEPSWNLRLMTNSLVTTPGADSTAIDALFLSSLGNTKLHPERSRELEFGFDAELWNGRVAFTFTPSYKLRLDAIQALSAAGSVYGGLPYYVNIGKVRNTGLEMSWTIRPIESPRLAWTVDGSFSSQTNKVLSLAGDQPYINLDGGNGRIMAGYPIDGRWARPIVGYRDADGDGRLAFADINLGAEPVYLGRGIPKYTLPFGSSMSLWRGMIGVDVRFDYQHGFTQFNTGGTGLLTNVFLNPNSTLDEQAAAIAAYCQLNYKKTYALNSGEFQSPSGPCDDEATLYGLVQTVNVLRIYSASVRYDVPKVLTQRFRVPRANVVIEGSNLALWTNYRGKDPNVNSTTLGELLSDTGVPPLPRIWRLRVAFGN